MLRNSKGQFTAQLVVDEPEINAMVAAYHALADASVAHRKAALLAKRQGWSDSRVSGPLSLAADADEAASLIAGIIGRWQEIKDKSGT